MQLNLITKSYTSKRVKLYTPMAWCKAVKKSKEGKNGGREEKKGRGVKEESRTDFNLSK